MATQISSCDSCLAGQILGWNPTTKKPSDMAREAGHVTLAEQLEKA
jgi:hypothetical protein